MAGSGVAHVGRGLVLSSSAGARSGTEAGAPVPIPPLSSRASRAHTPQANACSSRSRSFRELVGPPGTEAPETYTRAMVALQLVDILPELNGSLPHFYDGRWWIARDGEVLELDASLRVIGLSSEHCCIDQNEPVVRLADGGTLAVNATDTGFAVVRSNGDRFDIDVENTVPRAVHHPHGTGAVFEFPMGQDGTSVIGVDVSSGSMVCRELLPGDECTPYAFSPDGARVLVGPYPNDPSVVRVLSWPGGQVLHTLDNATVGAEQGFDLSGGYLGSSRTAMLATEMGIVIAGADLSGAVLIDVSEELGGDAFIESIAPLDADYIAAVVWSTGGSRATTLWRVV